MRRRGFLAAAAAAALVPRPGWAEAGAPSHLGCARDAAGAFWLAGLRPDGGLAFRLPLPARGHAGAVHPDRAEAVVFARRPGRFALVMDAARGQVLHRLDPPAGRQFNGHGAFLQDGALLCTSEVVAEGSAGRIGLWAVQQGYRRIGEWDSGGIGPHEVLALGPDRLAVANGGIATDPEDRRKLNLDRMRPSLVLLSGDGAALHEATLPAGLHQASIRHLAALPGGGLAFGCQWEGDPAEPVPVLGLWRPGSGEDAALTAPPEAEVLAMAGYAGSVASVASAQGPRIAVTSPRAGRVQIFDQAGVWIASHARADLCGLAAQGRGFVASDGQGVLWAVSEDALRPLEGRSRDLAWDNHLLALAPAAAG